MPRPLLALIIISALVLTASADPYLPGRVLVQFQEGTPLPQSGSLSTGSAWLDAALSQAGWTASQQLFPQLANSADANGRALGRTWEFRISPQVDMPTLAQAIGQLPGVAYAEPRWGRKLYSVLTPDDPYLPQQWHLAMLDCENAWWYTAGCSPDAVVGIIDSGVDYDHPDLAPNIWVNPGEDLNGNGIIEPSEINGIDDDGNGKVDDFYGWDFVDFPEDVWYLWPGEDDQGEDNDPSDLNGHGTHCAGDASQVCDNATGGGGVGWGVRIMAIRAGCSNYQGFGYIFYSSEGIIYATETGADVVSMSYGGTFDPIELNTINYAASQGVVLVAAAGNEDSSLCSYPAAYDHVIAVGATNPQDHMADFSNYGSWVDVYAPGVAIYSTTMNGTYGNMDGTSMACPITAGTAALVKSLYPNLTSDQVCQRLIATADTIQTGNPYWPQALRINAGRALDWSCAASQFQIDSPDSTGRIYAGQSANMTITLANHSSQALSGICAQISTDDPDLSISNASFNVPSLAVGQETDNAASPYVLTLSPSFQGYRTADLILHVTAANDYSYTQSLRVPLGRGDVLVVNADQGQSKEVYGYYTAALNELGQTTEVWNVSRSGLPSAQDLAAYPTIVWYTGSTMQNALPATATQELAGYLDNGGHLLLSGQNVARTLSQAQDPFLGNYLGCSYVADSSNFMVVYGDAGDPITNGLQFVIMGSGGAENQTSPDVIQANASGNEMLHYGGAGAVRGAAVHSTAHGMVVFLAFGFEAVNDSMPAIYNTRAQLMTGIMNWFAGLGVADPGKGSLPQAFTLQPVVPNPSNAAAAISYQLAAFSQVSLRVYDVSGRLVEILADGWQQAGTHEVWFDGSKLASGLYFVRLKAGEFHAVRKMVLLK